MFRFTKCTEFRIILLRLSENKQEYDNRFSEINIRSVNAAVASGNGVSNMQRIMTHLNLPMSAAPCS